MIKTINSLLRQKALVVLLFLTFPLGAAAQNVSLKMDNKPLSEVLTAITQATGYKFVYSDALEVNTLVTINCTDKDLRAVLDEILQGKKISYKIEGRNIALSPANVAPRQVGGNQFVVKGIVTDDTGGLMPGVVIRNIRTDKYTTTDLVGNYQIEVSNGDVLNFSSIGMTEKDVTVSSKSEKLNVVLNPNAIALNDVVVTGYQTISKERSAGSYAVVTSDKIQQKMQTNVMDRLEGTVAGLNRNRGKHEIRGVATLNSSYAQPLYVLDGMPFEGDIESINPNDIVNVSILKDAVAASIYGARSANGVIVITTRGGQTGKTQVNYNGSISLKGLKDRDYANRMTSSETIDYMIAVNKSHSGLSRPVANTWQNDVQSLILDLRENKITEEQFNKALEPYRANDRYNQVVDEYLRKNQTVQQHNLSFSGGSDVYKYSVSANYMGTAPYEKAQYENRIGYNIKNQFNFFKWLQVDAGVMGSNSTADYDNGILGMSYLDAGPTSFFMLRDDQGNPLQMYPIGGTYKSQAEIDRLKGLGLQDETFMPVNELDTKHRTYKENYLNLNIGAKFNIIDGLTASVRYQTETTTGFDKQYNNKNAQEVRRMINDATQINKTTGARTFNVPVGGQMTQKNNDNYSYTVRGQVDYNKQVHQDHHIQALAGAEVRKVVSSSNSFYRVGYDDDNLGWSEINALTMSKMLSGTEAQGGVYTFPYNSSNQMIVFNDNRYVSFYANVSWNYKERLTVGGSIRMDQSNLFGTDPKYQYRPLWSGGVSYVLLKDYKWLDRLVVRATYGISGNIPKMNGPYLIAKVGNNNSYTQENTMSITSPPNNQLRWEKTNVVNIGVDFSMFNNRLSGSVEYYDRNTTDLLGPFSTDPTLGWASVDMNFGSMYNRGVDVTLNSVNVVTKDFRWTSNFVFNYNKNRITRIESSDESAYSYINKLNDREGYARGAMFSVKYKGLDKDGFPVAYFADGTECKDYTKLSKEDLVYSGTYNPPYNAALTNTISYKGFDLGLMFVYSGGHVMKDIATNYVLTSHPTYTSNNADKGMINYWKKPGDENNPDTNPAYMFGSKQRTGTETLWKAADKHIRKADFIKLRDVTLSYTLPARLLKKTFISGVKVNFQARNLWYWAANGEGLDPEVWTGSGLSASRGVHYPAEFIFGLNLNF